MLLPTVVGLRLGKPGVQRGQPSLGRLPAIGAEEVDGDDLRELPAQARELSLTFGLLLRLPRELIGERGGFLGDRTIVRVARRIEQGARLLVESPSMNRASHSAASPPPAMISWTNHRKSSWVCSSRAARRRRP